jgi:hypothetical protein
VVTYMRGSGEVTSKFNLGSTKQYDNFLMCILSQFSSIKSDEVNNKCK